MPRRITIQASTPDVDRLLQRGSRMAKTIKAVETKKAITITFVLESPSKKAK